MKLRSVFLVLTVTTMMANSTAILAAEELLGKPLLSDQKDENVVRKAPYGAISSDLQPLTGDIVINK